MQSDNRQNDFGGSVMTRESRRHDFAILVQLCLVFGIERLIIAKQVLRFGFKTDNIEVEPTELLRCPGEVLMLHIDT